MNCTIETYGEINSLLENEIRELESLCNQNDGTSYSLFLENSYNADRSIDFIYLCRKEGMPVSILVLFFPERENIEIYGFTHPRNRRKGHFTSLIETARNHLKPLGKISMLFVCDPSSEDGSAFVQARGALLEETEYMMELNTSLFTVYLKTQPEEPLEIIMKTASLDNLESISSIASTMYDEERSEASEFVKQTILSDKREQLIGLVENKIAGICTIGQEEGSIMINGLAVAKSLQGRGYGRILLNQVITYALKKYKCPIKLEVSSVNDKAFNLYKSVGFEQKESYGYYREAL